MEYILLGLGIVFIVLGLFAVQGEKNIEAREELRKTILEAAQAKKDLESLMAHLERASETSVNQLEDRIAQALAIIEEYELVHKRIQKVSSLPVNRREEEQPAQPKKPEKVVKTAIEEQTLPQPKSGSDKYQTVYNLANAGLSVEDIARKAQIGKGEVALILEMKNRGGR